MLRLTGCSVFAAQRMLRLSGSDPQLGKIWIHSYPQRIPNIRVFKGTRLEKSRAEAVTPNKIKELYAIFEEPLIKAIRPANRWNVDETGVMEGILRPGIFLGTENATSLIKTQQRSDWRSIIECVSAEGNWLPPTIIFGGKNVRQQ